jgi:hypothetical protein
LLAFSFFCMSERIFAAANAMRIGTCVPGEMSAMLRKFFGRPFAVGKSKGQHRCRLSKLN